MWTPEEKPAVAQPLGSPRHVQSPGYSPPCAHSQSPGRVGAVSTHNLTRATASTSALTQGTETITALLINSTSTQNKKFNKKNKEVQHRSHQGKHPRVLWLQLLSPCALEAALQNQRSALAAARESPLQQRRPNTAKDK